MQNFSGYGCFLDNYRNPKDTQRLLKMFINIGRLIKARTVLTNARLKNPQNDNLCFATIHAKARGGNKEEKFLMANLCKNALRVASYGLQQTIGI